jgi:excisionase family DNA binding protein
VNDIERKFTTVSQAMRELRVPRAKVLALVHAGTLKSSRLGWHILIDRRSLAAYQTAQQGDTAA